MFNSKYCHLQHIYFNGLSFQKLKSSKDAWTNKHVLRIRPSFEVGLWKWYLFPFGVCLASVWRYDYIINFISWAINYRLRLMKSQYCHFNTGRLCYTWLSIVNVSLSVCSGKYTVQHVCQKVQRISRTVWRPVVHPWSCLYFGDSINSWLGSFDLDNSCHLFQYFVIRPHQRSLGVCFE